MFFCGIVSVFKLCFNIYVYISEDSHERPFHRRNRLFFVFITVHVAGSLEVFFPNDFRLMKLFLFY